MTPGEIQCELVSMLEGNMIKNTFPGSSVISAMELRGFRFTGPSTNTALRPELRGRPTFAGVCGPMYGGAGIIRYETQEVYNVLSS